MRMQFWTIGILLLSLGGCAHQQKQPVPMAERVATRTQNEYLAYALRYGALSAEAQKKEHDAILQNLSLHRRDNDARMRAAIALALPASRQRNNTRAIGLLDEVQNDTGADMDTRALALVLKEFIQERIKFEENASRSEQKLTDERKRADNLQQKHDALQQKADGLQQRIDDLQQKLDELKNIEKAMTTREQKKR